LLHLNNKVWGGEIHLPHTPMNRRQLILSAASWVVSCAFTTQRLCAIDTALGRVDLRSARSDDTPIRAVLDTGASRSSVSETLFNRLNLSRHGSMFVRTLQGRLRRPWTRLPLHLEGGSIAPERLFVMPDTLKTDIDYVLGGGDLSRFHLDFTHQSLSLGAKTGNSYKELSLSNGRIPIARLHSDVEDVKLIVDSGTVFSTLTYNAASSLIRSHQASALIYQTFEGEILRKIRIPHLRSGQAIFDQALFNVRPEGFSIRTRRGEVQGQIGLDLMLHGDWSFDYTRHHVSIRQSRDMFQPWFGLGVDFRSDNGDPGRVVGLALNGPARQAGLQLGDAIIDFHGVSPTDVNGLASIGDTTQSETLTLTIVQGGQRRVLTLETKALI